MNKSCRPDEKVWQSNESIAGSQIAVDLNSSICTCGVKRQNRHDIEDCRHEIVISSRAANAKLKLRNRRYDALVLLGNAIEALYGFSGTAEDGRSGSTCQSKLGDGPLVHPIPDLLICLQVSLRRCGSRKQKM